MKKKRHIPNTTTNTNPNRNIVGAQNEAEMIPLRDVTEAGKRKRQQTLVVCPIEWCDEIRYVTVVLTC